MAKEKLNSRFIRFVERNTISNNAMVSFLRLLSFCLSAILGFLILDFKGTEVPNTLFILATPIAFNLGIDVKKSYHSKGIPLTIILALLLVVYTFLAGIALSGIFRREVFFDQFVEKTTTASILSLLYMFYYFLEIILLFVKEIIIKKKDEMVGLTEPILK